VTEVEYQKQIKDLQTENARLNERIQAFVEEFRLCRFCKNIHADCSPTDGSCEPRWYGL